MNDCIGLDISKRLIAVHIPKNSLDIEINNNLTGMKKLISKLKKLYKNYLFRCKEWNWTRFFSHQQ